MWRFFKIRQNIKTRGQNCVHPQSKLADKNVSVHESRVVDKLADNNVSVHSGRVAAGVVNFIFSKAGLEVNGHCGVKGVFLVSGRLGVLALRLVAPTPTSQEAPPESCDVTSSYMHISAMP